MRTKTRTIKKKTDLPGVVITFVCFILIAGIIAKNYKQNFGEVLSLKVAPLSFPAREIVNTAPTSLNLKTLKDYGFLYPEVIFAIHFKETSFCRCEGKIASLCCSDLNPNPNNYFGMKHPRIRPTTSLGPISSDNPHATFTDLHACLQDMKMYENWILSKYPYPKSRKEYVEMLKKAHYNPYSSYFVDLLEISNQIANNPRVFVAKYGKYYSERIGQPLIL